MKSVYIIYKPVIGTQSFKYYKALIPKSDILEGFRRYRIHSGPFSLLNWDSSELKQCELRNIFERLFPEGRTLIPVYGFEFSSCNCLEILTRYQNLYYYFNSYPYSRLFRTCMSKEYLENLQNLDDDSFEPFDDLATFVLRNFEKFLSVYVNLMRNDNYAVKRLTSIQEIPQFIPNRECKDDSNRHVFDCFVKLFSKTRFSYSDPKWSSIEEYSEKLTWIVRKLDICGFLNPESKKVCSEVANRINRYNVASGCNILSYRCDQCSDENNWTEETVQLVFIGENKVKEFSEIITEEKYIESVDCLDRQSLVIAYEEKSRREIDQILVQMLEVEKQALELESDDSDY